jgi:hypothetical protein
MCIGQWANGKQCTREIKRDGACSTHYENPKQTLKAEENFKKCPSPEHKFSDSLYVADFVPKKDFYKKPGVETHLWTNCCFCRTLISTKRKKVGDVKVIEVPVISEEEVQIEENLQSVSQKTVKRTPYFPEIRRGKRPLYSEVVKCLESFGFVIQITEEEYNNLKSITKIPALCPANHGLTNVDIGELKRGSSCCRKCGHEKMKKTNVDKTGFAFPVQNPDTQQKMIQTYEEKTGYNHWNKDPEVQEKTKDTYYEKTGYEHPSQNPEYQEEKRQNYLAKTDGKYDHPSRNPEVIEARKQNYLAKTDGKYEHSLQNPEVIEKIKQTNLRKTGFEHYLQDPEFRAKLAEEYFEKTGYKNPAQNPASKEKYKRTNLERRGFEFPMQDPDIKEKTKETHLERRGVTHHMKDPRVIEQMRMNFLEKSGGMYEHPMQNPEFFQQVLKSMHKYKPFIFPSGKETLVQGYEDLCLNDLVLKEGINENDIDNTPSEVPEIYYMFKDSYKRYYPDIYVSSQNKIIEVKCKFTYEIDLEKNLAKARACLEEGYNFEFRIYDKQGNYTVPVLTNILQ